MEGDSDLDWTTDEEEKILAETAGSSQPSLIYHSQVITSNGEASSSSGVSYSKLINEFVGMGFSRKMVLKAIEENGEENTELILNALLTYSTLEDSPEEQLCMNSDPSSSGYDEDLMDDYSDLDSQPDNEADDLKEPLSEEHKMLLSLESTGSLSEKDRILLDLANMGYTIEEASIALERCGPGATITVLTDCICAAQISREEDCYLQDEIKHPMIGRAITDQLIGFLQPKHVHAGDGSKKKRKFCEIRKKKDATEDPIRLPNPMIGFGVPSDTPKQSHRSLPEVARGPPYFYYENVALAPKGAWETISTYLYGIEPEFVDSKYFCAAARKRGYIHNLPIENRFPLRPLPPLTIEQAFPQYKRWWPSWDERDKLNCLQTAVGSAKLTERIRSALERHDSHPPQLVQKYILEQSRKWNLIWVGRNKVAPLEPDEMETLLGFPKNHTRGGGISRTDRYKSLGNSFQVDTVAYHLSVLKELFPHGINVLSLFSGIGGAEVSLHRLGVKLNNVVSIEKSKVNRDIVQSWWDQTNQSGNLFHFDDVLTFEGEKIDQMIEAVGGFDLVVGGSPCNNLAGSNRVSRDGLEGTESRLFFEYVRILNHVRKLDHHLDA